MWNRCLQRKREQQQRMWNPYLPQHHQQRMWNCYLQRRQQLQQRQQWEQLLNLEKQQAKQERERMADRRLVSFLKTDNSFLTPWNWNTDEELKREMADRRLASFLETDNSFLTPRDWKPDAPIDIYGPSTSCQMRIEPGSFFSDNPVFSSKDQIIEYLSAIYRKLDSSDKNKVKQALNALLDQNLPRTDVETDQNPIGTDVEQGSNGLLDQNLPRTDVGTDPCTTSIKQKIPKPPRIEHTGFSSMAEEKKQPIFSKIQQLRPLADGLNLLVKVVDTKMIRQRFAESMVGDETGIIVFSARNDQIDLMKEGATVILWNAKIEMFRGSMRLAVDKKGRIEVTEPATFSVKEKNNLSLIEFMRVNI